MAKEQSEIFSPHCQVVASWLERGVFGSRDIRGRYHGRYHGRTNSEWAIYYVEVFRVRVL